VKKPKLAEDEFEEQLDVLEERMDAFLGNKYDFEEAMFLASPHWSIAQTEALAFNSETLNLLATQPDGEELVKFAEFLLTTKL
jgi:hypothetical protein